MKLVSRICLIAFVSTGLIACSGMSNRDAGVLTGAVVGGLAGSAIGGGSGRVVATAVGAVAGSLIGGRIGADMDQRDRARMMGAIDSSPTGKHTRWVNPDTGHEYDVVAKRTYYVEKQPCREYVTRARIDGKMDKVHGTACRSPDGRWRVTN